MLEFSYKEKDKDREKIMKCGHCKEKHNTVSEVRNCAFPVLTAQSTWVQADEPGMYKVEDSVFLVTWNDSKTRLYAKKLVKVMQGNTVHKLVFEYDKGSIFKIGKDDRMTAEQVAQLGKTTGHCWVCARKLTVQKSIQAGIGPVCATKV